MSIAKPLPRKLRLGLPLVLLALARFAPAWPTERVATGTSAASGGHWNLDAIYSNTAAWEKDFARLQDCRGQIGRLAGTVGASARTLREVLEQRDRLNLLGHRLACWAQLRVTEDGREPERQLLLNKVTRLVAELDAEQAFIEGEILAMAPQRLQEFLAAEPGLQPYRPYLDDLLRIRPHRLNSEAEAVLVQARDLRGASQEFFKAIKADVVFASVTDGQGQRVPLKTNFLALITSPEARVRREAYRARLQGYEAHVNELGLALAMELKRDLFLARARHAGSCLALSLEDEAVPEEVFTGFIAEVKANSHLFRRWLEIRRKLLGVAALTRADLYPPLPIPGGPAPTYNFDEAVALSQKALTALGPVYLDLYHQALSGGWVDVFPAPGKDTWPGAATGVYGGHPYINLNWDGSLFSLKTLVHELGHAIGLSCQAQDEPFLYQQWWFCTSEVPSTCNEILLKAHLLTQARDKATRLNLLADEIDRMTHLFFDLGMLSDYEQVVHAQAENGGDLSPAWLRKAYRDVVCFYTGEALPMEALDEIQGLLDLLDNHWGACYARYVYALGYAAALDFARRLLAGEEGIQVAYRRFLGRARAHYPMASLREAGVDFTTARPFKDAMRDYAAKIDQFEALLQKAP